MNDALGLRMKAQYEDRTRLKLPRRTYTILRIDGRAFHTYTRSCAKPFDENLHAAMVDACIGLAKDAQGCQLGYVQSDEASLLLTDFNDIASEAWFDGNLQKICSIAASQFTSRFSSARRLQHANTHATFDCRVFTIPDPVEVENYFIWRNKDAIRNSVSSLAQSLYSAKQLNGVNVASMLTKCQDALQDWNVIENWKKFGTLVTHVTRPGPEDSIRHEWVGNAACEFTKNRTELALLIPRYTEGQP